MCVLGVGEKVEVWCELESVASAMENFGVKGNFLVGFEVRGISGDEDVDASLLLFSVRCFVSGRGLAE